MTDRVPTREEYETACKALDDSTQSGSPAPVGALKVCNIYRRQVMAKETKK